MLDNSIKFSVGEKIEALLVAGPRILCVSRRYRRAESDRQTAQR
jgi:hypothetical protein